MKRLGCLWMAVLLLTGLAGCGSKESEGAEKDTFVVGMECNYAPFNWTEAESSDRNVAVDAGGSIDAIIAGMTDTEDRRKNADFTTPYYQSKMAMIVLKDGKYANATSLADFKGATVQGQLNTMYDDVIDQIEGVTHAQPLENYPYMIAALKSGTVDALTAETPVALGAVAAHPELAMVEFEDGKGFQIDLSDTAVSIAVKKGNTELLNSVQSALDKMSEDTRKQMMEDATKRQPAGE